MSQTVGGGAWVRPTDGFTLFTGTPTLLPESRGRDRSTQDGTCPCGGLSAPEGDSPWAQLGTTALPAPGVRAPCTGTWRCGHPCLPLPEDRRGSVGSAVLCRSRRSRPTIPLPPH